MTALKDYARIESMGVWKPDADAQRRDVIVMFGEATLMIRDKAERPLAHWSLPAIARLNPGARPALFSPDPEGDETLEIEDDTMIDAIETVRKSLARRRARPGRLRDLITVGLIVTLGALALFWLPGALVRQSLASVSEITRREIGRTLLDELELLAGPACTNRPGQRALATLTARLSQASPPPGQIVVLPKALAQGLHLPGGLVVLAAPMVEDPEAPEATAGYALAALAKAPDPMETLLDEAGPWAVLRLLTSGSLSPQMLRNAAERLATQSSLPAPGPLLAQFEATGIPSRPWAYDIDPTGENTLPYIEGDPAMPGSETDPLLDDGAWVALQSICDS